MTNTQQLKAVKLIVAGTRTFNDYNSMSNKIMELLIELSEKGYNIQNDNVTIISGMASGADMLGVQFSLDFNLKLKQYPANWSKYGKPAGMIRNKQMAKVGNVLIVFWDGISTGTKSMISIAKKEGLEVKIIKYKWNINDNTYTYEMED